MSPAAIETPERSASKHDKKAKKEKKHKSEKKRAREDEDAEAEADRRPKKSKSEVDEDERRDVHDIELELVNGDASVKTKKKKSKKVKEEEQEEAAAAAAAEQDVEEPKSEKKKSKKKKKREDGDEEDMVEVEAEEPAPESTKTKKKKSKKHSEHAELLQDTPSKPPKRRDADADADADAMELDEEPAPTTTASSDAYQPPDIPAQPQFPFFTQTVSLYEAIYPQGWSAPVTNCEYQHLRHLKNRYVPSLRGVLLDYRNVALGDAPGRAGAARSDEDATTLKSVNEFAVGFGWITADVDLFVPSRGAWMEGSVNLQTEGHIGVVCFGKFNASVEARRLPPAWKWVSNEDPEAAGMEETASVFTADDHGVTRQIHSTGFWVDGDGAKVKGRVRFRIRNFDVGTSGDTSYLSLEGTMLDRDAEKKLVKEEALLAEQRRGKKGGRRVLHRRRAPEFAMTRFADEEAEAAEGEATADA